MKVSPVPGALILGTLPVVVALAMPAHADPVPKHAADYAANYRTLTIDQGAAPEVAACIATGYDLVQSNHEFDRLGFTRNDIASTDIDREPGPFSPSDRHAVSWVIAVSGEARQRSDGTWLGVTLRCGYAGKRLTAIEIVTDAAQD